MGSARRADMLNLNEAAAMVADHVKWLEGPGNQKPLATAMRILFIQMQRESDDSRKLGLQMIALADQLKSKIEDLEKRLG